MELRELVEEAKCLLDIIAAVDKFDIEVGWADEGTNDVAVIIADRRIPGFYCRDDDTIAEVRRKVRAQALGKLEMIVRGLKEALGNEEEAD